jgi:hypothetical protein
MRRMRRRLPTALAPPAAAVAATLAAALALTGCGGGGDPPFDTTCSDSPQAIERALQRAPAPVKLASGTRLSDCVARARSDADLQNAGAALTRAADDLADRAKRGDARAATGLGYLVGAARRGAARTAGIHAQLERRMETAAAFLDGGGPEVARALRRGMRAGEATG